VSRRTFSRAPIVDRARPSSKFLESVDVERVVHTVKVIHVPKCRRANFLVVRLDVSSHCREAGSTPPRRRHSTAMVRPSIRGSPTGVPT
jgi:hypothetical protein